jgi:hypothetical protein
MDLLINIYFYYLAPSKQLFVLLYHTHIYTHRADRTRPLATGTTPSIRSGLQDQAKWHITRYNKQHRTITHPQVIVQFTTGGKPPAQYHTEIGRPKLYNDQQDTSMNYMQLKIGDARFDILLLTF